MLKKVLARDVTWLSDFRADLSRYDSASFSLSGSEDRLPHPVVMVLTRRELWALLHYRLSRALRHSEPPSLARRFALLGMAGLRRPIEICSGISLPDSAVVGPGLRFAHPGLIVISAEAIIGRDCLIAHGVTVGASGAGVPVIGDGVVINANAVVAGDVHVGDGAVVSACSLVTRDVPPGALARGVPAQNLAPITHGAADQDVGA